MTPADRSAAELLLVKILVLGGTRFLGRAVVEQALGDGIEVTCFRRGTTEPDQPLGQLIRGDRTKITDLDRLATSGEWDTVVDTSAYIPEETHRVAAALEPVTNTYLMVSTVAVYRDWPSQPTTESSPVFAYPPTDSAEQAGYGALKAGCEAVIQEVFGPDRTLVLRPGAILGPHDYLGRLPWWLLRIARGGRVLAPGSPHRLITPVDVRDVADFSIRAAGKMSGIYNVAGPSRTMGELLEACRVVTGSDAVLEWVTDEKWLGAQQEIQPWTSLPLWRTDRGVWEVDTDRAQRAGLTARSFSDTVASTWQWLRGSDVDVAPQPENGISPEVERALLGRWDHLNGRSGAPREAPGTGVIS